MPFYPEQYAADRRSSIRELVHEPINTRSIAISVSFCPGVNPIYSRVPSRVSRLLMSASSSGLGIYPVTGSVSSGLFPHVNDGAISPASTVTSLSNIAPGSVASVFQSFIARSQSFSFGACFLPFK